MTNDRHLDELEKRTRLSNSFFEFARRVDARTTPIAVALVAGLVRLAIGCYELSLPNVLGGVLSRGEGYDEGSYLGAATRLAHGLIPYKDFIFPAPPGIAYLMAPVALLGRAFGTNFSVEMSRVITVVIVAMDVVLAGLIVRRVGRLATAIAAFSLAVWPFTVAVDPTMELEPYLVFFCLLGIVLIFDGDHLSTWRRVLIGGIALGFAVVVKAWGILPIVAVAVICAPRWRRRGLPLAVGIAAGIFLPCVVYLIVAPHAFVENVINSQLYRKATYTGPATSFSARLILITAIGSIVSATVLSGAAVISFLLFWILVFGVYVFGFRRRILVEWFVLAATLIVFVGMFKSPDFYIHYGYFPAPFFAMLLGISGSHFFWAVVRATKKIKRIATDGRVKRALPLGFCVAAVAVVVFMIGQDVSYAQSWLAASYDPDPVLDATIPAGSCVVFDLPTELLTANRYSPASNNCPAVVDPFGMWLVQDDGNIPHTTGPVPAAFQQEWLYDIKVADYVAIAIPFTDAFAWSPASIQWFNQNYRLVTTHSYNFPTNVVSPDDLSSGTTPYAATLYIYKNMSSFAS